ncbi:hypothetical protein [Microlunatus speluncae]|uniref:hypothetical protein n=1 Tax=Microlunatus speluncae TaxID=2594267 RepID=UPI0012663FC9|nr:hypothetical protein [Microlunatus speluncae]
MAEKHAKRAADLRTELQRLDASFPDLRERAEQAAATTRGRLQIFETHPTTSVGVARNLQLDPTQFVTAYRKLCVWAGATVDVVKAGHGLCVKTLAVVTSVESELMTLGRFRAWSVIGDLQSRTEAVHQAFGQAAVAVREVEAEILKLPPSLR